MPGVASRPRDGRTLPPFSPPRPTHLQVVRLRTLRATTRPIGPPRQPSLTPPDNPTTRLRTDLRDSACRVEPAWLSCTEQRARNFLARSGRRSMVGAAGLESGRPVGESGMATFSGRRPGHLGVARPEGRAPSPRTPEPSRAQPARTPPLVSQNPVPQRTAPPPRPGRRVPMRVPPRSERLRHAHPPRRPLLRVRPPAPRRGGPAPRGLIRRRLTGRHAPLHGRVVPRRVVRGTGSLPSVRCRPHPASAHPHGGGSRP